MSPLPKEFDPAMYKDMHLSFFDRLTTNLITREFIDARIDDVKPPDGKITIDTIEYQVPRAILVRGASLLNFLSFTAHKGLMPQSASDRERFWFWTDNFGLMIQKSAGEKEDTFVISNRYTMDTTISWKTGIIGGFPGKESYISGASRAVIIALTVARNFDWKPIKENGLFVCCLRGDVNDAPWKVPAIDVLGALLPNTKNILSPNEFTGLCAIDQYWLSALPHNNTQGINRKRQEFLKSKINPLVVFSDLRTMK